MSRFFERGDWAPGGFSPLVNFTITLTLLVLAASRGADYAWGDSAKTAHRLSQIEAAAPLAVWGWAFLAAVTVGFISIIWRCVLGIAWAHFLLWSMYWAIAVGLLIDVYEREEDATLWDETIAVALVAAVIIVIAVWSRAGTYEACLVAGAVGVSVVAIFVAADWDGLRNATAVGGLGMIHAIMGYDTAAVDRRKKLRKERGLE